MKRVLVTGGAGFIGHAVVPMLAERGWEVTVLDNLSPQIHGVSPNVTSLQTALGSRTKIVIDDVRNRDILNKLLEGQDAVLHLAAETGTGQSMYEIERYVDVNIGGTAKLLDLVVNAANKPKRVVVASSRAIYGEGAATCPTHGRVFPNARLVEDLRNKIFPARCPICRNYCDRLETAEDTPAQPSSVYGQTKLSQEQLTLIACESAGIPAIALRYQNVYGPGQSLKNPYTGILSIFSTAILSGAPIRVFEDGEESRDFIYVEDVARATCLALEAEPEARGAINVGSAEPISVLQVVNALTRHYGQKVEIAITGEFRVGDIRHGVADLKRAQALLGFTPQCRFDDSIARFVEWVQAQPRETSGYAASLEEMRRRGLLSR
jgi:dTDP-L-rhamnose 4-epimerase